MLRHPNCNATLGVHCGWKRERSRKSDAGSGGRREARLNGPGMPVRKTLRDSDDHLRPALDVFLAPSPPRPALAPRE